MSEATLDRFQIVGGACLVGDVSISGAKNSILKLMAVTLMAPGKYTLSNVPDIADVSMMGELLVSLGCEVNRDLAKC
ncbi:MAG: UDP-N-acetylglucosamine 1-carboxyvinyltransferase, partial [Actinobacteria bacterium]|nr:UDP-N-acetylglucosamine 1-carboxyvinyltransferase [Actinomycetota bacterium]